MIGNLYLNETIMKENKICLFLKKKAVSFVNVFDAFLFHFLPNSNNVSNFNENNYISGE